MGASAHKTNAPIGLRQAQHALGDNNDLDDLIGIGIDNADLVADDKVAIASVGGDNDDDILGDGAEFDSARYGAANIDRDIHVGGLALMLSGGALNLGALLLAQRHAA